MKLIPLLVFVTVSIHAQTPNIEPSSAVVRHAGLEKRKLLEEKSLVNNVKFRNIGPTIMSGRAVDLEVNPIDPTEFYIAYASGGLWHTINNGQSFTPIFDKEDAITIGDIAVNWKNRNIWVGTGEANSSRSSYAGTGIYFSADTGKSWQYKGLPESHHIGKILLTPDPQVIIVGVLGHLYSPNKERGIYKTTDGGSTWKLTLYIDDNTGAADLFSDPKKPAILYACMWHRQRRGWNFTEGGKSSGIYKSTDNGDTWSLLTKEGSGFPTGEGVGRTGLAIYPENPDIIYAFLDNQNHGKDKTEKDTSRYDAKDLKGIDKTAFLKLDDKKLDDFLKSKDFPEKYNAENVKELVRTDSITPQEILEYINDANNSLFESPIIGAEIYRSENGGVSWTKTNTLDLKNLCFTYGYYFGKIFISPKDDKKIYVCGYPLVKSVDGGKTFLSIDGDNTHPDHHAVWINPDKDRHMIICNDGGVNITYDEGKTWFKANTPPVGQFYTVAVDNAKPYNVYGGLQDNGVWAGPSTNVNNNVWLEEGTYPFQNLMGGDGMQVQVDTRDNATTYTGYQFGFYYRINRNTGDTKPIKPRNDIGEPNYRFNWQTPIWLSKHNMDILYFGTNRFHRSMEKGANWKTLSDDLTSHDKTGDVPFNTIVAIHESPTRFGLIYCGTDDGHVWCSKDAGYTWKNVSAGLPAGLYVSRVTASAFSENRVYASVNGYRNDYFAPYVFVSENNGDTWKNISSGLPEEPVNVIKEDVKNQNLLFCGTDNGLYISVDRGNSWMGMNKNLPRVAVHDLVVHPRENELVLGTHGRSFYIASLKEIQQITDSFIQKTLFIFPLGDLTISKNWGKGAESFSEPAKPSVEIGYYSRFSGVMKIQIVSRKGNILKTFTDSAEAGLNYITYDVTLDSASVKKIEKENKITLKKAENENYFLPVGKYIVAIISADGLRVESPLEIKSAEKKSEPEE
jgi:photosystem II stability/assembly factor-like uncharacterized protein